MPNSFNSCLQLSARLDQLQATVERDLFHKQSTASRKAASMTAYSSIKQLYQYQFLVACKALSMKAYNKM